MSPAFLQAAASYFGINPEQLAGSDWHNADGQLVVAFEFNVSEDDLVGIVERMKVIKADADLVVAQVEVAEPMTTERMCELRGRWNEMDKSMRVKVYRSFAGYVAVCGATSDGAGGRKVLHVQTEDGIPTPQPDLVWLTHAEATEAQKQFATDINETGVQVQRIMLTPEQAANR